jgi:hypothetical protein
LEPTDLDNRECVGTVFIAPITTGELTITRCATGTAPGITATVGATVKNTGNMNNNAFVIEITVIRVDNSVIIANESSGNLTLVPGETSAEYSLSFIMPDVNIRALFTTRVNPDNNY